MNQMETLTAHLSNAMHVAFLLGIIAVSLIRLTDGRRELLFERVSLFITSTGAFFLLVKAAHPSGTSFEILIMHGGVFLWICSQVYNFSIPKYRSWKSK